MTRTCDICENKIGLKAFRCQDGKICKKCYGIVSNGFTDTITGKTLAELMEIYQKNNKPIDLGEDGFYITRKVGTFLLLDERNKKFCIPGNPTVSKEYSRPEIYYFKELKGYRLVSNPEMSPEELVALKDDKESSRVIKSLKIQMKIENVGIRDLMILSTPVRSSSYAFRQAYQKAMDVMKEFREILE